MRKPTHPGRFFKKQVLDELNMDIKTAAECLGISRQALSSFVNEHTRCTQEMAARLAMATGTGVAVWINMQAKLDTWYAEQSISDLDNRVRLLDECA